MSSALRRIKNSPFATLQRNVIEQICREHKHTWRVRELDPATTIALFVQQIVHGNTPCSEVRHIAGESFSTQAYDAARKRLPLKVYQSVLTAVHDVVAPLTKRDEHLWHGHRTFHIDGSTFSMPDTPDLQEAFGMPSGQKAGCGFPVAHLLVLFNAATGLLFDAWASPLRTGDVSQTAEAHAHLEKGDIILGDDTFSNYTHLAMLAKQGLHGLFPSHHLRIVDFKKGRPHTVEGNKAIRGLPRSRWIKSLGKEDQLVEYFKSRQKPEWISQQEYDALPDSVIVRELRRKVRRPGLGSVTLTLVTTLLDPEKYPAEELLELRLRRWDVETNLGHLKTTMKMDVLRCKSEEGVRKELTVFCIVYNCVRVVMLEASRRQGVAVSRVSFADAYKWVRHAKPGKELRKLIVVPYRPNRAEPRCKKRRPKQFDLMNEPRAELRKRLKNKAKEH